MNYSIIKYRLAALTSHPIQYQTPLFQKLAEHPEIDLMVYFCWDFGIKPVYDKEFGKKLKWDIPLLEGYKYKFLKNYSLKQSSNFWGQINFGIIKELVSSYLVNKLLSFKSNNSIINNSITKNYDAVVVFGWNSFTNWLAFIASFLTGIPVFLRGENPLNQELLKPEWKRRIKRVVLGWLFRRISAFLYIGEENKKFYKYYGVPEEKLFFCPYAVDNARFINEARNLKSQISNFKNNLGIDTNDVVILFVGKLIEKKRPIDLLKAYETITRNTRISPNIPNKTKIVEKELSYKLTGIFFEIHNELGRFARERQYADACEVKLKREGIKYRREFVIDVVGRKSNIADFIVEDKILVELKRKPVNTKEDYKQVMRYLESANLELGLLVNFQLEYLKPKRILNPKLKNRSSYSSNSDPLANSGYGIHLVFVGDGVLRPELENYARKIYSLNSDIFVDSGYGVDSHYGIHFVGFKNQTELPAYYAISDIFVLPSGMGETWGLVVNEAMCFGLPVIVSNMVGCGSDLVKNGENGYIFPVGDIEKLAEHLADLIKSPQKRKEFGKKSLEIIKNYSYDKDIEGILKAINIKDFRCS